MANSKIKTEMTGTGGGRWGKREEAKRSSNKRRREIDKQETKKTVKRKPKKVR